VGISLRITISDEEEVLKNAASSLVPDNNDDIAVSVTDGIMTVDVKNLKISSIYNLSEDILRCYEISKKLMGEL
jgi:hypothetical protein